MIRKRGLQLKEKLTLEKFMKEMYGVEMRDPSPEERESIRKETGKLAQSGFEGLNPKQNPNREQK